MTRDRHVRVHGITAGRDTLSAKDRWLVGSLVRSFVRSFDIALSNLISLAVQNRNNIENTVGPTQLPVDTTYRVPTSTTKVVHGASDTVTPHTNTHRHYHLDSTTIMTV